MKMHLPKNVEFIIDMLEKHGYEAYAVGGCVRDSILGREPDDWDITTIASPGEVKQIFRKTVDTGLQHGTVTVLLEGTGYEVTTYRIDGEYEDNRHPKTVEYTRDLRKDLERRDFTINAMAYSHKRGMVDIFGGVEDLKQEIIRCVGAAGDRFDEDALRMMRAVRFSAQLGFRIDEATKAAIVPRACFLKNISAERIRVELTKLLTGKDAGMLETAYDLGLTGMFLPEFDRLMKLDQQNPHHVFTVGKHTIRSIEVMNLIFGRAADTWDHSVLPETVRKRFLELARKMTKKQQQILCLTMLFHDMGKAETKTVDEKGIGHFYGHAEISEKIAKKRLRALTYDNETISVVTKLVKYHDVEFGLTEKSMRRRIAKIGPEAMELLFLVKICDACAQNPEYLSEKMHRLLEAADVWEKVMESDAAFSVKDLAVNGTDIIGLGVKAGPEVGKVLGALLERVLENPEENQKERLAAYVKAMLEGKTV